jgi:hypothetical protein
LGRRKRSPLSAHKPQKDERVKDPAADFPPRSPFSAISGKGRTVQGAGAGVY